MPFFPHSAKSGNKRGATSNPNLAVHSSVLRFFLALIAASMIFLPAWGQSEAPGVVEIQYSLDGSPLETSPQLNLLRAKTVVQPGAPLSYHDVRKSIEAIYAIGDYSYIRAIETQMPMGVRLIFQMASKVFISKIEFIGASLDENRLRDVTRLRPGDEYSLQTAQADRERILKVYKDYGFFEASVKLTSAPESVSGRKVNISYKITEKDRARIGQIQFEGVQSIKTKELQKVLKSQKGEFFERAFLEDDVNAIVRLYREEKSLIVDVEPRFAYDKQARAVTINYHVIEGKRLTIKLVGRGIDRKEIRQKLTLFREGGYSKTSLSNAVQQIQRIYQQKGYTHPQVRYQIEQQTDKEVVIRFNIHLGRTQRIRDIHFEGNQAFDANTLREQMKTQPPSWFRIPGLSWLFSKGVYDATVFETDRRALELFYRKAGYLDVQIDVDKEIDADNRLTLYIKIDEGEQQRIHQVSTEGDTILTAEELNRLEAKSGKPYSKDLVTQDLLYLRSLYDKKGYIYANIEPAYGPETGTLVYRISEGHQARLGTFHFFGNERVRLSVFRREFEAVGLSEGAVFNADRLIDAQQRLFRLGLFRTVQIETPARFKPEEPQTVDVNIRVEPKKPGLIGVSGGFSPSEGYRGTISFAHNNLFKRNMRGRTEVSLGTRGNLYEAVLTEPWLKLPLVGYTMSTFRLFEDNLEDHDDTRARGGIVNLAKQLGRYSDLALQYKYQSLRQQRPELPQIQATVSSIGLSFHRNTRDHFLDPKNGWLNEAAIEHAGGFLRGKTDFLKLTTDHRYYRQLRPDLVLAHAIRLGYIRGLRGNREQEIISFERFRAGGSTTVRGYGERELGPEDEAGNRRGDVLVIFNTELRFPIYKLIGGAVFFDTGNVWDKLSTVDTSPLHSAVGIGIRVDTPVGPARFDLGLPLRKGFDGPRYWLQLGQAF